MSTLDLVVKAIETIGAPRRGASYLAIQKWIASSRENATINRLKADLKKAIEKGLTSGILKRPTISKNVTGLRGYFVLNKDAVAQKKQDEVEIAEKLEEKAQVAEIEKTKAENVKETKAAAIKKDEDATVKKAKAAAVKKTKAAAVKKTKAAAVKKTKAAAVKKTKAAAVKKTKAAAVKKTKAAAAKETKDSAIQAPDSSPAREPSAHEMEFRFKLFLLSAMLAQQMSRSNDSGQGSSSDED